ncbi:MULTISPECIES: hypothetical protein [Atopobiaceae]|uniref:hypothetical protein n=1 Tax=Atopobiaceae TaxID=1643824 RepID=UPI00034E3EB5|nr:MULTISPECIES: hypothetical protein [Atopobiaceae]EPD78198.1 hypothetical protein HMPREF1527_00512 [Atopobium sp. oral taxon 199 str. F0494]
MSGDMNPLSEEERAELERLRQEKRVREEARRNAAERAELEQLRAERTYREHEVGKARQKDQQIAQARARGARLMQPDEDDLKMPLGQKIVILSVVLIAILFFIASYVVR